MIVVVRRMRKRGINKDINCSELWEVSERRLSDEVQHRHETKAVTIESTTVCLRPNSLSAVRPVPTNQNIRGIFTTGAGHFPSLWACQPRTHPPRHSPARTFPPAFRVPRTFSTLGQ